MSYNVIHNELERHIFLVYGGARRKFSTDTLTKFIYLNTIQKYIDIHIQLINLYTI